TIHVTGDARLRGSRAYILTGSERREVKADAQGNFNFDVTAAHGREAVVAAVVSPTGATYFERAYVGSLSPDELNKAEADIYPPDFATRAKDAKTSPQVEGEDVTLIYTGDAKRVEVVGDFTGWAPSGLVLRDAPGATNVKYIRLKFPKATRAEYKLIA